MRKKGLGLRQALFDSGILESGDPKLINEFKKAHRDQYSENFQRSYRKKKRQKLLTFSHEEMEYLEEQSKKHGMKVSPFIRAVIFSYLNSSFVFPNNKSLDSIDLMLREINNRISQTVQYAHLQSNVSVQDIQDIKDDIQHLSNFMKGVLERPPRLEQWLENQIERDELFLSKFLVVISNYLTTSKS